MQEKRWNAKAVLAELRGCAHYPLRVGKHIVCIDGFGYRLAAIQTACRWRCPRTPIGALPQTPYFTLGRMIVIAKTKELKSKMVAMRFSEREHTVIKSKAEKAKMNFTEFITASALNKSISVIEGLDEVQREQKAIGKNLNQLTTLCNMGKIQCLDLAEVKHGFGRITERLGEIIERYS